MTQCNDFSCALPAQDAAAPSPQQALQAAPAAAPAVAPAMALALVSELDWIEDHLIDVYRGSGRDRGGNQGQGR